jgi:hypothetical protein
VLGLLLLDSLPKKRLPCARDFDAAVSVLQVTGNAPRSLKLPPG